MNDNDESLGCEGPARMVRPEMQITRKLVVPGAPVAWPDPVGFRHSLTCTLHETEHEVVLADAESEAEPLFTKAQVVALLAAQPVSAPAREESIFAKMPDFLTDTDVSRIYRRVFPGTVRWRAEGREFAAEVESLVRARFAEAATSAPSAEQDDPYGYCYCINGTFNGLSLGVTPPTDDCYEAGTLVALYTRPQPSHLPDADGSFQARVEPWVLDCFGAEIASDKTERNHRFIEEALELAQSLGCTASECHQLVDYVFGRPPGDPAQEVGGVMVTLAALCLANGLDMHKSADAELERISEPSIVLKIRAKQAAKPKNSPLPIHPQQEAQPAREPMTDEQVEALVDALSEWSRHVEVDTAPRTLEKHVRETLAHHGITAKAGEQS